MWYHDGEVKEAIIVHTALGPGLEPVHFAPWMKLLPGDRVEWDPYTMCALVFRRVPINAQFTAVSVEAYAAVPGWWN